MTHTISTMMTMTLLLAAAGCGGDDGNGSGDDTSTMEPDAMPVPVTFQETALTLSPVLVTTPGANPGDPDVVTLAIKVSDGAAPVITDLWLYTLDAGGARTPLTGFTSTAARKNPNLLMPATLGGQPSGLSPASDGGANGLMTNTTRGKIVDGALATTFDGKVTVTLPAAPTSPILVVAGVEDQRYAGAAVIQPDGTAGTVPAGTIALDTHTEVSFARDVTPILAARCGVCHKPDATDGAIMYLVTGTRDELVNDNFALTEETADCLAENPDRGAAFDACVQAITKGEFLVEPGVPATSGLLTRSRPDEDLGSSATGLTWWGSHGVRYNAEYGDRRMPSTTVSTDPVEWLNDSTDFDSNPAEFQVLYDWVAQGARP